MFGEGAIAQLVERLLCKQDVVGSNPSGSTKYALTNKFFGGAKNTDLWDRLKKISRSGSSKSFALFGRFGWL